jgi:D-amino-acid dehydrogenase
VVVGAGVVGLASAYALARDGIQTVVLERETPGAGSSWRNAGWIAFAPPIVSPVPGRSALTTSLRWLLHRDSPLRLIPRLDPQYARWLVRFVRSCSDSAAASGLEATRAFNAATALLFDELAREAVGFEMETSDLLIVYRKRRGFLRASRSAWLNPASRILSQEEARREEPLLADCAGAISYAQERYVRPEALINALVSRLIELGVEFRYGTPCVGLARSGSRITHVETNSETLATRVVVLATGADTRQVGKQVGLKIPIEAGRGYSIDVSRQDLPIRTPVYLYDERIALTPFREITRISGFMELGASTAEIRDAALATMAKICADVFTSWPHPPIDRCWAGLRPMTPDGLPIIGRVPNTDNLYLATGHAMLGVTLSLRTGVAIAEHIRTNHDDPLLVPFLPGRFSIAAT